jgi:hypothetical protein
MVEAGSRPLAFAYSRSLAPMMWVLMGLSLVEIGVVHLLIALLLSHIVALLLSAFTAAFLLWLVLLIRSFARLPVLVSERAIVMRAGFLRSVEIPLEGVATVRGAFSGDEIKRKGVLNLALLAFPNVLIELRQPLSVGRRSIKAVAHKLDEPAAFFAALGDVAA